MLEIKNRWQFLNRLQCFQRQNAKYEMLNKSDVWYMSKWSARNIYGGNIYYISGLEVKLGGYKARGQLEVKITNFVIYEPNLIHQNAKNNKWMGVIKIIFQDWRWNSEATRPEVNWRSNSLTFSFMNRIYVWYVNPGIWFV